MNKRQIKKTYKKSIYKEAERITFKSKESKKAWINDQNCTFNTPIYRSKQALSKYFLEGY